MDNMPIVRVELERMRQTLMFALSAYHSDIEAAVNESIKRFVTPEHLQHIIDQEADRCIDDAIKSSVKGFFQYGEGHRIIQQEVMRRLADAFKPSAQSTAAGD